MRCFLAFAVLACAAVPAPAQERAALTLDQRMSLRCSAAFALVAHGQEIGSAEALAYPPLGAEAREYFVRAAAQVMDEAGLDEEGIQAVLAAEAQDLVDRDTIGPVMQVCLPQLGLATTAQQR